MVRCVPLPGQDHSGTIVCPGMAFLTVLTQQSALRSVHPLSNDMGYILKKKVTSVKHKPAGGIAMPGGIITFFIPICDDRIERVLDLAHIRQYEIRARSALRVSIHAVIATSRF